MKRLVWVSGLLLSCSAPTPSTSSTGAPSATGDAKEKPSTPQSTSTSGGASPATTGGATPATTGSPNAGGWGSDPATRYTSGTRLKVQYLEGDDGTKAFTGFYDTVLSMSCTFLPAADGKTRCMPPTWTASAYMLLGFSDDKCTQPFIRFDKAACGNPLNGSPAQRFVSRSITVESGTEDCPSYESSTRIFTVTTTTPVPTPEAMFDLWTDGRCVPFDPWFGGDYVTPAREMSLSEFVMLTPKMD